MTAPIRLDGLPSAPPRLDPAKFAIRTLQAKGERRAVVGLSALKTLWINTGTLCNLACANCYIESTPRNDQLAYITAAEVASYLDEIDARASRWNSSGSPAASLS
jgi:pyruvate formate-lyase activating enzyme-like uncharacterized protein